MLIQNKRIAIIGGGPGGLTLARLLQLKGAAVTVYERDRDRTARIQGSSLDLHEDSGLAAVRKALLLDEFKKRYRRGADRMVITDAQGTVFFSDHDDKPETDFGNAGFRPEIDRGPLRDMLLDSLMPGTVVWDRHFISMEKQQDGWLLHFKNTSPVEADIVIGADGANSRIRPYLTDIKAFYSGITMLEGVVYGADTATPQVYGLLQGGKIMAFGNGKNLLMGSKGSNDLGFYASIRKPENWYKTNGLDYADKAQLLDWFKKEYPEWNDTWHELFEQAEMPMIPRPIFCMPTDLQWATQENLTIIGDAAHVMPPFAGEGVNMAMQDALELSGQLTSGEHTSIQAAIAAFETNMRRRAAVMAQESLDNGERMHGEHALAQMLGFFADQMEG